MLASGQAKYENRIGWAMSHLTKAKAIDKPRRGDYRISNLGRQLLQEAPEVSREDVFRVTGYKRTPAKTTSSAVEEKLAESLSPEEMIDQGIGQIHSEVSEELLTRLHEQDPAFFERAVIQLMVAMGYGGEQGRGRATPLTQDGGIDGIIDQDALGLNRVYLQAKRYRPGNSVGRPEVQSFVGALSGEGADRGIFITTGHFSKGAVDYAESVPARVILIDGQRLARLMIKYQVGVQPSATHIVVKLDEDFFE